MADLDQDHYLKEDCKDVHFDKPFVIAQVNKSQHGEAEMRNQ